MNRLNYRLLNILIVLLIVLVTFVILSSYNNSINMIKPVLFPIVLSFLLSYSFYPCIKIINKKLSYNLSCLLFLLCLFTFSFFLFYFLYDVLKNEIFLVSRDVIKFINSISFIDYNFKETISSFISFEKGINYISYGYSFLLEFILVIVLIIYFTFNMEKIRMGLLKYDLFRLIDKDLYNYNKGLYFIIIIEFFEYLVLYFIIGHPYFLLIGMLSIVASIIPVVGAFILNLFALISAYFVSMPLFIITSSILIILPIFNNYIIEPKVYNKTSNISFISVILSVFVFGYIFSFLGVLFSIPFYIITKNLFNYYLNKKIK